MCPKKTQHKETILLGLISALAMVIDLPPKVNKTTPKEAAAVRLIPEKDAKAEAAVCLAAKDASLPVSFCFKLPHFLF